MLAAALVGVSSLSLIMSASAAADGARQATIAYNAARQALENVRSLRGAPLANRSNAALIGSVPQLSELNNGTGTLSITTYRAPVKQVTVTINWRAGGRAQARSITVTTLVAPGGVTL